MLFVGLIATIIPIFIVIPFEHKLGPLAIPIAAVVGVSFLMGAMFISFSLWQEDISTDNPATINHLLKDESNPLKENMLTEFNIDSESLEKLIEKETGSSKVSIDIDELKGLPSGERSFTQKAAAGKIIPFTAIKDNNTIIGNFYYEEDSMVIVINSETKNVEEIVIPMK